MTGVRSSCRRRRFLRDSLAFTLTEMLAVMLIILLLMLVVPALAASRSRVLACEPGGSSGLFRSATVTAASGDGAQRFDEYR